MTVPSDLAATVALRADHPIVALDSEHSDATVTEPLGMRAGRQLYRLRFGPLAENLVTIRHQLRITTSNFVHAA